MARVFEVHQRPSVGEIAKIWKNRPIYDTFAKALEESRQRSIFSEPHPLQLKQNLEIPSSRLPSINLGSKFNVGCSRGGGGGPNFKIFNDRSVRPARGGRGTRKNRQI